MYAASPAGLAPLRPTPMPIARVGSVGGVGWRTEMLWRTLFMRIAVDESADAGDGGRARAAHRTATATFATDLRMGSFLRSRSGVGPLHIRYQIGAMGLR